MGSENEARGRAAAAEGGQESAVWTGSGMSCAWRNECRRGGKTAEMKLAGDLLGEGGVRAVGGARL